MPGLIGPPMPDAQPPQGGGPKVVALASLIVKWLVLFHIMKYLSLHAAHHGPWLHGLQGSESAAHQINIPGVVGFQGL
ncbi:hypothetical protein D3C71_2000230 [compost metagenome]